MAFSKNCRFSRRFDADPVADVPLSMAENKSDPKINYSNRLCGLISKCFIHNEKHNHEP